MNPTDGGNSNKRKQQTQNCATSRHLLIECQRRPWHETGWEMMGSEQNSEEHAEGKLGTSQGEGSCQFILQDVLSRLRLPRT